MASEWQFNCGICVTVQLWHLYSTVAAAWQFSCGSRVYVRMRQMCGGYADMAAALQFSCGSCGSCLDVQRR